jgi:hypothetical protein
VIRTLGYPNKGSTIAQAIIDETAVAVCDGSYKDNFGTGDFILQWGNSKISWFVGAHATPGHPDESNPYRSELGGIPAIIVVAEALASFHDIQTVIFELGCDCESAIMAIFEHTYDTPKQPHHNLIHEIREKLYVSKLTWKYHNVKGHQDKRILYHVLIMWGQLNIEIDSLTKVYWNKTSLSTTPFYPYSTHSWSIWTGTRKVSNLRLHLPLQSLPVHQCHNIPLNLIHSIDWEASQQAIKQLGLNYSLWIPKWLARFAPVGKV